MLTFSLWCMGFLTQHVLRKGVKLEIANFNSSFSSSSSPSSSCSGSTRIAH